MSVLVMDLGTSGVRSAIVHPDASVTHEFRRATLPDTPVPGLVEFDALVYANHALECARETLAEFGTVAGLGISNQRATTIVIHIGRTSCKELVRRIQPGSRYILHFIHSVTNQIYIIRFSNFRCTVVCGMNST